MTTRKKKTPPSLRPVDYPGLGRYLLTPPQLLVVRELLSAILNSRSPDVAESHLLRVSGLKVPTLRDVFQDSPAWGRLVLPGSSSGAYRLYWPAPVEEPDQGRDELLAAEGHVSAALASPGLPDRAAEHLRLAQVRIGGALRGGAA